MLLSMSPQIHRTEINGVPTVWADLPGPFSAQLAFGVGMRDEPPHLMGVTHLVEHLVFNSAGDLLTSHNGGTELDHTWFSAWGETEAVTEALGLVTKSLSERSWTAADVDHEKRVIEIEAGARLAPGSGTTTVRFGLGADGNADAGVPTVLSLSREETIAWARRWFVRENATLWLTGPPPPDLRLDLVQSPDFVVDRTPLVQRVGGQALVPSEKSGVALSLLMSSIDAPSLGSALTWELSHELRSRRGVIYDVDVQVTPLSDGSRVLDLVLDPHKDDTVEVVRVAVELLRRLAEEGFSSEAMERNRRQAFSQLTQPVAWEHHLDSISVHRMGGTTHLHPPDALLEHISGLGAEELRALLRDSMDTLLVFADEDSDGVDEDLATSLRLRFEENSAWTPNDVRRRGGRRFRGSGFLGFRDHIGIVDGMLRAEIGGDVREIDLSEVVVAGRFSDHSVGLLDIRGRSTVVDAADWRAGEALSAALLAALPERVRRDFTWFDDPPYRRETS